MVYLLKASLCNSESDVGKRTCQLSSQVKGYCLRLLERLEIIAEYWPLISFGEFLLQRYFDGSFIYYDTSYNLAQLCASILI